MNKFNPRDEVPSLELCKRLKELGFPQEDYGWYWDKYTEDRWFVCYIGTLMGTFKEGVRENRLIKAPTVRELGEWLLPVLKDFNNDRCFYYYLTMKKLSKVNANTVKDVCFVLYSKGDTGAKILFGDTSEADARAMMLIWLAENGYVKFEEAQADD